MLGEAVLKPPDLHGLGAQLQLGCEAGAHPGRLPQPNRHPDLGRALLQSGYGIRQAIGASRQQLAMYLVRAAASGLQRRHDAPAAVVVVVVLLAFDVVVVLLPPIRLGDRPIPLRQQIEPAAQYEVGARQCC